MIRDKDLGVSKKVIKETVSQITRQSKEIEAAGTIRPMLWKVVELNHHQTGEILNATFRENTPNKMTEFLRYTVPDDVILLVQKTTLRCKLFEADGTTEVLYGDRGLVCGVKPADTFIKELADFNYSIRADLSFMEQGVIKRLDDMCVSFPDDSGVIFHPKQALVFSILTAKQLPATAAVHANARWSFKVLQWNESAHNFYEMRTRGLINFQTLSMECEIQIK